MGNNEVLEKVDALITAYADDIINSMSVDRFSETPRAVSALAGLLSARTEAVNSLCSKD